MSRGVIVGYDGSDCAKAALRTGIEVGRAYDEPVIVAFGFELSPVGGELHDYHAALRDLAASRVAEARELASGAKEIETVVIEDSPAQALVELGRQRDARVIVVGTRGEGPIRGALLGAVPHKLLQLADRPVLVVPAD